jgi:glycosyltransferase involved in cell wall biosynthesis
MAQKIKVLECIRQGQIGGGESHLLSLVEHLDKNLFEPVVLSFTDGPMVDRLKAMNIPVHLIPTTTPFDVRVWGKVKQLLQQEKIELVHAHGTRAASNVLWASRSLHIPVIYTIHGWSFHPDQSALVRTVRIWGEKYLTSKSDLNISVSRSNQQSGKDFMPSFDSVVINNGIDLQKFHPQRPVKDVRKELNIAADATLILFIARFTAHKQPLSLLRAFARALPQQPNLHLLMVGDGDEKEAAVQLIQELGIAKNVTLEKFRQDVPDVLACADVFVLPSLWEGLPIGLLEAMAMGKAIIASKVDGTSEIIQHGKNGWLVDTNGLIDNLVVPLLELSRNPGMRQSFSAAAIATVTERFNAAHMTRQIEQQYLGLLGRTKSTTAPNKTLQPTT